MHTTCSFKPALPVGLGIIGIMFRSLHDGDHLIPHSAQTLRVRNLEVVFTREPGRCVIRGHLGKWFALFEDLIAGLKLCQAH